MKTKKILSMLVAMTMLLICFGITAFAEESATVVAKIGGVEYNELHTAMTSAKAGETVDLISDVDLSGTEWEPVSFKGKFNGNGHTIKNLTINKAGVSNTGFITSLNGMFENVTFENPAVTGGENTGVLAGRAGGSAAYAKNINVTGTIKVETTHSGYARAGVIVGGWAYGKYENITVDGTDKANSYIKHTGGGDGRYVAGIVGHADDVDAYINCTVKNITISGGWLCGGIAGPGPSDGIATGCMVENIDMGADYSGGMFGWYYGAGTIGNSTVKDVTFTDGSANNGAIGGYQNNTSATVTNVTIENVKNANGAPLLSDVAKIGDTTYATLEAAFTAATEGQTITLLANTTPALASQRAITKAAVIDLNGKTLTLTEDDLYFGTTTFKNGDIVVAPSVKASTAVFWMFANQTLTFDNVKLTATGVTGTYLIGLDGNNSDLNLLNGSEIIVNNTTALDLDIICVNASTGNDILIDNSKVNVTNLDGRVFFRGNYTVSGNSDIDLSGITKAGFRIEAGQTLKIEDTATVDIDGEPRDGGIHITDATAVYTVADTATVNATVNAPAAPELPTATVGEVSAEKLKNAPELTFSKRFVAADPTDEQKRHYGKWFADFELTVNKKVTFNAASTTSNGYLAGSYEWYQNGAWISVPFEDVTLEAGQTVKIMSYAAELMGQSGLKLTYNDVLSLVQTFDCGVFFTKEYLAANPDLEVTLELRMYNPNDESESHVIGETYTFKAPVVEEESPYIFGKAFYMVDLPEINGRYQVGLYAGIDSLKYKEVGFKIYDQNEKIIGTNSTNTVYTSVKGKNMTVTAEYIGSFRIFGATAEFGKGWDNIAVFFRPYAIDLSGKEILGYKYKIADIYTKTSDTE